MLAGGGRLAAADAVAKYVFLFIGDGMGREQVHLTETVLGRKMCFRDFPFRALTATYSASHKITDSAAAGTAIACGVKTNNGVLGLDPAGKSVESVAVDAKRQGRKVGIMTSVPINHATPAAFFAHQPKRSLYDRISDDMAVCGFEFLGGSDPLETQKDSHLALFRRLGQQGYRIVRTSEQLTELRSGEKCLVCRKIGWAVDERGKGLFSLADIVTAAIRTLDNEKGFFIMAEGGAIDWACHNNDAGAMIHEMTEFENAINVALRFAAAHPGQCLIVVTADHETGGMKFVDGKMPLAELRRLLADRSRYRSEAVDTKPFKLESRAYYKRGGIEFSTLDHSPVDIMTYAIGSGASAFNGRIDNTAIPRKIRTIMGVKTAK